MSYGEKTITTPLMQVIKVPIFGTQYQLADLEQMEEVISANMESLIDINQNLGILTDFGSLPIVSPPRSESIRTASGIMLETSMPWRVRIIH